MVIMKRMPVTKMFHLFHCFCKLALDMVVDEHRSIFWFLFGLRLLFVVLLLFSILSSTWLPTHLCSMWQIFSPLYLCKPWPFGQPPISMNWRLESVNGGCILSTITVLLCPKLGLPTGYYWVLQAWYLPCQGLMVLSPNSLPSRNLIPFLTAHRRGRLLLYWNIQHWGHPRI